jgi:hypothetical protein
MSCELCECPALAGRDLCSKCEREVAETCVDRFGFGCDRKVELPLGWKPGDASPEECASCLLLDDSVVPTA